MARIMLLTTSARYYRFALQGLTDMLSELANCLADSQLPSRECDLESHLRARILSALRTAGYRELWSVRCHIGESVVVLRGVLPSYHLKQVAQQAILVLNDRRVVKNLIEVSSRS